MGLAARSDIFRVCGVRLVSCGINGVFYKESGIKTTSSLDFLLEECASFS